MAEVTQLRGRPSAAHLAELRDRADDAEMELVARADEAADFVEAISPHLRSLEWASREFSIAHRHATSAIALVEQLSRRWQKRDAA